MLPYFTVSAVVGVMEGTTSGMTLDCWNAERIWVARDAAMPEEVGHMGCLLIIIGEA